MTVWTAANREENNAKANAKLHAENPDAGYRPDLKGRTFTPEHRAKIAAGVKAARAKKSSF